MGRKYHYETIEGKKKRVYEDTPSKEEINNANLAYYEGVLNHVKEQEEKINKEYPTEQCTQEELDKQWEELKNRPLPPDMVRDNGEYEEIEPSPNYTQEEYEKDKEKYPQPLVNMCKMIAEDKEPTQHRIYEVKDGEATLLPQEEAKKIYDKLSDLNLGQTHIIYKPNNLLKKLLLSLLVITLCIFLGYGLAYLLGLLIAR